MLLPATVEPEIENARTPSSSSALSMSDFGITILTKLPAATEADRSGSKSTFSHVAEEETTFPSCVIVARLSLIEYPNLPDP